MTGFIQAALRNAARNSAAEVRGEGKKQGKKCRQNEKKRCTTDTDACKRQVVVACDGNAECIVKANVCCETCSADGFVTCVFADSAQNSAVASLGLG